MYLSVFDIFKIGVGPSSSHTMGPMTAAADFVRMLSENAKAAKSATSLTVRIYGSLALPGRGHATDRAIMLGLMGMRPDTMETEQAEAQLEALRATCLITLDCSDALRFDPSEDLIFEFEKRLEHHTNGMRIEALDAVGTVVLEETYCSIGGGFVLTETQITSGAEAEITNGTLATCPYPFKTADVMLKMGKVSALKASRL